MPCRQSNFAGDGRFAAFGRYRPSDCLATNLILLVESMVVDMVRKEEGELNGVSKLYQARLRADLLVMPTDADFQQKYPQLYSLLGDNRVTEDKCCDPVRLSISNNAGDWLFSIYVPGLGMSGEHLASTFAAGLVELEGKLAGGTFGWKANTKKPVKIRSTKKPVL